MRKKTIRGEETFVRPSYGRGKLLNLFVYTSILYPPDMREERFVERQGTCDVKTRARSKRKDSCLFFLYKFFLKLQLFRSLFQKTRREGVVSSALLPPPVFLLFSFFTEKTAVVLIFPGKKGRILEMHSFCLLVSRDKRVEHGTKDNETSALFIQFD